MAALPAQGNCLNAGASDRKQMGRAKKGARMSKKWMILAAVLVVAGGAAGIAVAQRYVPPARPYTPPPTPVLPRTPDLTPTPLPRIEPLPRVEPLPRLEPGYVPPKAVVVVDPCQ